MEKCSDIPARHLDIVKGVVYGAASAATRPNLPLRYRKAITSLRKDRDIHIAKADKSNTIVILDKESYNDKVMSLLNDQHTYQELLKDPLDNNIKIFNSTVKKILSTRKDLIKQFTVDSPSLAYMYGTVKLTRKATLFAPLLAPLAQYLTSYPSGL